MEKKSHKWLLLLKNYSQTLAGKKEKFASTVRKNLLYFPDPNAIGTKDDHFILCYPTLYEIQGTFGYFYEPPYSSPTLLSPFPCAITMRNGNTYIGIETNMLKKELANEVQETFGMKMLHKKTNTGKEVTYLPIWVPSKCEIISSNQLKGPDLTKSDDSNDFRIQIRGLEKDNVGSSYYSICRSICAFNFALKDEFKCVLASGLREEHPVLSDAEGNFAFKVEETPLNEERFKNKQQISANSGNEQDQAI